MNQVMSRPLLPTALLLALATFLALAAVAGAEKVTTPAAGRTPEKFAAGCLGAGGELIEVTAPNGTILESGCYFDGEEAASCDWVKQSCTDILRDAPDSGSERGQFPTNGVLDDPSDPARPGLGDVAAPPTDGGAVLDGGR